MKLAGSIVHRFFFLSTVLAAWPAQAQAPAIELSQRPLAAAKDIDATLTWVADDADSWSRGKPLFDLANKGTELKAKGWAALTPKRLVLQIEVTDDFQINDNTNASIWNGDFLRVTIDGWGDGTRGAAKSTRGPFGPDDRSFGYALTNQGPVGWNFSANRAIDLNAVRDEANKRTTYRIGIEWEATGIVPGAFATFGLGITVRDADKEANRNPPVVHWGEGGGAFTVGLFKTISFGKATPPDSFGVFPMENTIWGGGDAVKAWVNALGAGEATVVVQAGGSRVERKIAAKASPAERRLQVSVVPGLKANLDAVKITVVDAGGKVRAEETITVKNPRHALEQVVDRLDTLIASATPALFKRHLISIKALTLDEWGRLQVYRAADPNRAEKTARHLEAILTGLSGDAATWKPYIDGRRSLTMAFTSKKDGSLQQYTLTLPKGWNPKLDREHQPAFPLFIELHGSGDDHKLGDAAAMVAAGGGAFAGLGYEASQPYARATRKGYHVEPFGRGNLGYRGIAETDVWEAYEDARAMFKVDETRQYLYGFSMGGGGTWSLGTRTPDRWAAIAVLGSSPRVGRDGVGSNLAAVPVYTWSGAHDEFAAAGFNAFVAGAKAAGVNLLAKQTPGLGHNYSAQAQKETYEWLLTHTRKRPTAFSFVADTDDHLGQWGIEMRRDLSVSGLPRFKCKIEGNKVTIDSEGSQALRVDLGSQGLNMKGKVTVVWNGKTVFEGDPKTLEKPLDLGER